MTIKTIHQLSTYFQDELKDCFSQEEIRNFIALILEYKLGYSKVDILMKKDEVLGDDIILYCEEALVKLQSHVPIQYVLGETEFYNLKFKVNSSVLIPRPETEELVHWIIKDYRSKQPAILDVGTGTGCIPIILKKNIPNAKLKAWDISVDALNTARSNAELNQVQVIFEKHDALDLSAIKETFDVIVSNPPYVLNKEKELMQHNVLDYEPHLALFVPDHEPLLFYKAIAEFAKTNLNAKGALYFEINEAFGDATVQMLDTLGFKRVELRKDLFGKDRMVKACVD